MTSSLVRPSFSITGNLSIERNGKTCLITFDLNNARSGKTLTLLRARTVAIPQSDFSIERLQISPVVKAALELTGVHSISQLPKDVQGWRSLGLHTKGIQSVLSELRSLGLPVQESVAPILDSAREEGLGWLTEEIKKRPVQTLKLSAKIVMRLLANRICTVGMLCDCTSYELERFGLSDDFISE